MVGLNKTDITTFIEKEVEAKLSNMSSKIDEIII